MDAGFAGTISHLGSRLILDAVYLSVYRAAEVALIRLEHRWVLVTQIQVWSNKDPVRQTQSLTWALDVHVHICCTDADGSVVRVPPFVHRDTLVASSVFSWTANAIALHNYVCSASILIKVCMEFLDVQLAVVEARRIWCHSQLYWSVHQFIWHHCCVLRKLSMHAINSTQVKTKAAWSAQHTYNFTTQPSVVHLTVSQNDDRHQPAEVPCYASGCNAPPSSCCPKRPYDEDRSACPGDQERLRGWPFKGGDQGGELSVVALHVEYNSISIQASEQDPGVSVCKLRVDMPRSIWLLFVSRNGCVVLRAVTQDHHVHCFNVCENWACAPKRARRVGLRIQHLSSTTDCAELLLAQRLNVSLMSRRSNAPLRVTLAHAMPSSEQTWEMPGLTQPRCRYEWKNIKVSNTWQYYVCTQHQSTCIKEVLIFRLFMYAFRMQWVMSLNTYVVRVIWLVD